MLHDAGSAAYLSATQPPNSSTTQRPLRVARTARPGDLSAALEEAAALGRSTRAQIEAGSSRARQIWTTADTGLTPGSWVEGAAAVPNTLPAQVRERARVADAVDPGHRLRRSRLLG